MERKIIYLINPVSGTGDKDKLLRLIEKKSTARQLAFEILHTRKNGNYDFLVNKITTENITDIVVCGGDGTVNQVAAALQGTPVNIGIIPMGSGNGLALAAGIPRNPSHALEIIFSNQPAFIDSFYINRQFSCMLCGLGFDAQVAHDFARQPTRGLATYIEQTVRNFFTAKTYPFIIKSGSTTISTEAFFISIANSNQFGNNVTIAPRASISDGLLDIVVVNKMSKLKMIYTLLKQVRLGQVVPVAEKKAHAHDIHYFQAKKIHISNPGRAPLHIDGEPVKTATEFEIEIIPNAFKLLQP